MVGWLRKYGFWLFLLGLVAGLIAAPTPEHSVRTRLADGFDEPVGKPDGEGYYKSRGFRANYHMGEDWNGLEGGNRDLGKPVFATAHGVVVLARDMRMSWGNLVIIRHAFLEDNQLKMVDSVYGHLDRILVKEGQQVVRGQQVGTIGTAHGHYPAHLHFEIRKNLAIGFNQRGFPRDLSSYYVPSAFIAARRKLPGAGRSALVPIDTFQIPGQAATPSPTPAAKAAATASPEKAGSFRVSRFDEEAP